MPAHGYRPTQILFNVAFAALCCGLATRGGIIMAMAPNPNAPAQARAQQDTRISKPPPPPRVIPDFDVLAPRQEDPVVPPVGITETKEKTTGTGPLVPLANASVVAITWFDVDELSLCSVVYNNEHTVHSINECSSESRAPCSLITDGYRVVRILADRIFVLHEASGQEQELTLYEEKKKKVPEVAAAEPEAPKAEPGKGSQLSQMMDQVKQVAPNHWEAPAGMRENVLGRLNEVAMEGRWLPFFENGKIAGFKLAQTIPNSAFDKIGLKSGDVIKSVNGFDISSPDKMLDVFTKLKDARDINVDILRGGSKKTSLNYTIN
jgi:type II secretion system protein C